ncbi:MAG: hypothetical protein IPL86_11680 [Flavobacteriales bacterium]|nr:hypothetical protein [Flavobacteriales bacterium]
MKLNVTVKILAESNHVHIAGNAAEFEKPCLMPPSMFALVSVPVPDWDKRSAPMK